MRKNIYITALLGLIFCATCFGASYTEKARYWCSQNGHMEGASDIISVLNLRDDGRKGNLWNIIWSADSWKIANPPSKATLDALDDATVDAWVKAVGDAEKGNEIYDSDTGVLIQAVLVVLKQKNPDLVLPTKAEVIAKYEQIKGQ